MSMISDEKLVTDTLNGDTQAQEMLEERVESEIRIYIEEYLDQDSMAVEILESEISLHTKQRIISKLDKYVFGRPFYKWVHAVTRREILNYQKKKWELRRRS